MNHRSPGVAVKVTLVPAQIVLFEASEAIVTLTGRLLFTTIVMALLVAGLPVALGRQVRSQDNRHYIAVHQAVACEGSSVGSNSHIIHIPLVSRGRTTVHRG